MVLQKLHGTELGEMSFMCLGKNTEDDTYFFINTEVKNSSLEKVLGIIVDNKLQFKIYVKKICKKASQEIRALSRLGNYLKDSEKNDFLMQ